MCLSRSGGMAGRTTSVVSLTPHGTSCCTRACGTPTTCASSVASPPLRTAPLSPWDGPQKTRPALQTYITTGLGKRDESGRRTPPRIRQEKRPMHKLSAETPKGAGHVFGKRSHSWDQKAARCDGVPQTFQHPAVKRLAPLQLANT